MAEAAVEDRPSQRFYCHVCNVQFENAATNFTCPHCSDGFIEELQENLAPADDVEDWEDDEYIRELLTPRIPPLSQGEGGRRTGSGRRHSDGSRSGRRYANTRARIVRPRTLSRLASSNLRQNVPFENFIQDFIINLGVGLNWGATGNMQLFLGNPGDYAWGREGLDAIVTQLLNQMDSTGPPPVSKEVIDSLPIVKVGKEQVDTKLQCSVCWEDFQLCENVRQLPCQHIYHEPCIRPWLELHGTCPICRQNLTNDEQNNDNNRDNIENTSNIVVVDDDDDEDDVGDDDDDDDDDDDSNNEGAVGGSNSLQTTIRNLFQPSSSNTLDNNSGSSSHSRLSSNHDPDTMM